MNFAKPASVTGAIPLPLLRPRRKWPISYRSISSLVMMADVATIVACGIAGAMLYHFQVWGATNVISQSFGSAAVVAAFYVTVMKGYGLYNPAELLELKAQITSVTSTWLGVFLFLAGAVFTLKIGDQFSRGAILSFVALGLVLLIAERILYRAFLRIGLKGERFSGRNAILITDEQSDAEGALAPKLLKYGFHLDHQFVLPVREQDPMRLEDAVADIVRYLRGSDIEEVIVSADMKRWDDLTKLLSSLRLLPLPVSLIPAGPASELLRRPSRIMGDSFCIEVQREPLDVLERAVKRSIDVLGASVGLILLLPLLLITAITIKLESRGPILFRQRRCGFNGKHFNIYKFRTMSVLEDGSTVNQATQSDSRVTRVGKWLRRMSIDELPQLLNVLSGSMSLVGPRPHALAHDNHFYKVVRNYAFRHHVKPGLTGWAQVNGYRGPTPTEAEIRNRVECDLWYIDNWSLRLDFWIAVRTVLEVIRARNAY
jgi:putative colanic acid biosynthesis UDP-glucose lipid carrier transferase